MEEVNEEPEMDQQQTSASANENINRRKVAADISEQQRTPLLVSQEYGINLLEVENEVKRSQESFQEFLRDCERFEDKVTCKEQKKLVREQNQLCISIMQDKQEVIEALQEMLRMKDKKYLRNLRKNAEELDLKIKEFEDEVETETKAWKDEVIKAEIDHQQKMAMFSDVMTKEENDLKAYYDNEFKRCIEERKTFIDNVEKEFKLSMQSSYDEKARLTELISKKQALLAEIQRDKGRAVVENVQITKRMEQLKLGEERKQLLSRQQNKERNLKLFYAKQQKEAKGRDRILSEKLKRREEQAERRVELRKKAAIAHARKYKAMEQMIEEDLTQLAERALSIDAEITRRFFPSSCKQPQMASLKLPVPSKAQELVPNISQLQLHTEEEKMGAACSLQADTETPVTEDSGTEWEDGKLPSILQRDEKTQPCRETKPSTHKFHWESLGDVISEDKRRLWRAIEKKRREENAVLLDIRYLQGDNELLKKWNAELKKQVLERFGSIPEVSFQGKREDEKKREDKKK
nr:dynein regulatory complex protein 1 [Nothobranchius furzeri]